MPQKVFVVGVGMTKFEKPGKRNWDYPDMAVEAGRKALADAGIPYENIQQATVGYCYGDSTCGQRAVYGLGLTGIPIYNVNNNCSTGATALHIAKQLIEGGNYECVLALGFEKMERGSLAAKYTDRTNPLDKHLETMSQLRNIEAAPFAPQMFGNAGREHMEKYGTSAVHFAKIAEKNHRHSANNPYSQFRDVYSLDQILASPKVFEPLTRLQCCPTSEGSAAAILCNEAFVHKHRLEHQAIEIAAMEMATDLPSTFDKSCIKMVGADMTKSAALKAYTKAGVAPKDIQVIELHDCFSTNELVTYESLGLCGEGEAGKLIDRGDVTYGGKWVVNPSGGLISKGHPLGATGLAQCAEICWQLRQMCGKRQVPNARIGMQHNLGLGGAAVVGIYKLGFPDAFRPFPASKPNPAIEASGAAGAEGLKSDVIFSELSKRLAADSSIIKKVNGVYQFNITSGGATKPWTVDLKNGNGSIQEGAPAKADCTITLADGDFVDMITGKANGNQLFMAGKLKIAGNMGLAMKLEELKKLGPVSAGAAGAEGLKSDVIFSELSKRLAADSSIIKKVNGVYQFNITSGGATKPWTVDLKNGNGSIQEGAPAKADCTITLADGDFVDMITGKANGNQLFMAGKLKIAGNMGLAMKLEELKKLGPVSAGAAGAEELQSDAIFPEIAKIAENDPSILKKIDGVYQFKILTPAGGVKLWLVDLKNAPGSVRPGKANKPDCTVTISDNDFVQLLTGNVQGNQLFMAGKLKIEGSVAHAMKLEGLKSGKPLEFKDTGFESDFLFAELEKMIHADQTLLKKIGGVFRFDIKGGRGGASKTWTVDVKNGEGFVKEGLHGKHDSHVTINDEDFVTMVLGGTTPQQLFVSGKLKVTGNLALAMKLADVIAKRPTSKL